MILDLLCQTSLPGDLASFGAAGIMGGMWLWERRSSRQREEQLTQAHGRILRDEQRLDLLTQVVEQNTAAIARFAEGQHQGFESVTNLLQEIAHGQK